MVRGIDKFREFFAGYEANYVIIGGTACEIYEEIYAQTPRATKDMDIILVVEALSSEFVARFWEFVKAAGYMQKHKGNAIGELKHEYYRFREPNNPEFPYQIELFSRSLGFIDFPDDAHITPVPVNDDLSSLSAILLDDDYYNYTISHSTLEDDVHIANIESLICLKCRAYIEMTERRNHGEQVDSKHISKHKKDVFRLVAMLAPSDVFEVPATLMDDVDKFCESVKDELPNEDFFKSAGLQNVSGKQLLEQMRNNFKVQ